MGRISRRAVVGSAASAVAAGLLPGAAAAQEKALKIFVGFPAGGGLDAMTRVIAEKMREKSGTTVVIENRPGAAGRIAAEAVVRSEPDGSALLSAPIVATAFYPFIFKTLPFDPLVDLAPISRFCTFQFALAVNAKLPVTDLKSFIAYAKENSGKINFGSLGAGTPSHFLGVMMNQATGLDMAHVPYRGSAPAITDLLGGSIQAVFDTTASLMQQYKSGALRLLATTGTARSPNLPEVPTFAELKLGLGDMEAADFWYGFFAPGKTPDATLDRLNASLGEALGDLGVQDKLAKLDVSVVHDTRAQFARIIKDDHARWGRVIKSTGFSLE